MNKLLIIIVIMFFSLPLRAETLLYNYSDTTAIPIKLSIIELLTTKNPVNEGQYVNFRVLEDVNYNGATVVKAGDIVPGRVETIITSGMNGFPAEIIIDDFQIPDIKASQLICNYNKHGQNRCLWVYPLKWSLTLIPFVGSLTNFIKGGHAKIKPTDVITIYYYPNWQ